MMRKNKAMNRDSAFFWNTAGCFLNNELPNIRKKSPNTVSSYRMSLNIYIDYLEAVKSHDHVDICFEDFSKDNLKGYLSWMYDTRGWCEKTCNLRMTAIRSLLSFASEESLDVMPVFMNSKAVKGFTSPVREIEYFEDYQLKALLSSAGTDKRSDRRNRMILILGYDAALRVSELISLKLENLHLTAEVPYLTIFGKGSKYRNVPLMEKTVLHLKKYMKEFHLEMDLQKPLFYVKTHGINHCLSDDTIQMLLKRHTYQCRDKIYMPEKVHFHMLRKTRAMNLYQSGCPLSYIQQLLGHENISTTSGFYAFATLKTLADAIEKTNPTDSAEKCWKNEDTLKKLYRL
jgi:site-specific recombinase XerD